MLKFFKVVEIGKHEFDHSSQTTFDGKTSIIANTPLGALHIGGVILA